MIISSPKVRSFAGTCRRFVGGGEVSGLREKTSFSLSLSVRLFSLSPNAIPMAILSIGGSPGRNGDVSIGGFRRGRKTETFQLVVLLEAASDNISLYHQLSETKNSGDCFGLGESKGKSLPFNL